MSRPSEKDPQKEWIEKLFGECVDEFHETFGVYDGTFMSFFKAGFYSSTFDLIITQLFLIHS